MATASFTVATGCTDVQISLVSYQAPSSTYDEATADQQVRFKEVTQLFGEGTHTLSVEIPNCYFQVDLVRGTPIEKLGPAASDNFYTKQGRLVVGLNGGSTACAASPPPPTCPASGMVTSESPITVTGSTAKVSFTIAAGCTNVELSLVSYKAPSAVYSKETAPQQELFKFVTVSLGAGSQELSVEVPNCYFQVDFVYGKPITKFGGTEFYSDQGRFIEGLMGGTTSCTQQQQQQPPAQQPPAQQPPAQQPPAQQQPVQQTPPVVTPPVVTPPVVTPTTPPAKSGVAGVTKTIVHKKAKKLKKVKKQAKPAKAVVRAAKFTG